MVEVFKTNITDETIASRVLVKLASQFPSARINFDLEDIDNILRVDSSSDIAPLIAGELNALGYHCEVLE